MASSALPIYVDPTPVPVDVYAERMKTTVETLMVQYHKGKFPALRRFGRSWYVMPVAVARMSIEDGDVAREKASLDSKLETGGGETPVVPGSDGGGSGRGEGRGSKKNGSGGRWSNPLG